MAEVIISPVVDFIISTLGSAAVKKIGELHDARDDLEVLQGTLETIKAVLLDAERQQGHNNQVRLWLQRLEDVVNDADDLIDGVATEGLRRELMPARNRVFKSVRLFCSSSNQLVFRSKLAKEIRIIRKKMVVISAERRDFKLNPEEIAGIERRNTRETHSLLVKDSVVGRIEEEKRVLDLVQQENEEVEERVRVVSIYGMGGLGKTTLAKHVFSHESDKNRFDEKIWVCVSDDFNVKRILGLIMRSSGTMETLQMDLRKRMDKKRYLLVLDDVWNEDDQKWKDLMEILSSCGDSGSTIIVTTRSKRIADLTSNVAHRYNLGNLSDDDSWSLFKKVAFEKQQEPTEADIVKTGKEIVKKCGGIPLAIVMIARLMSRKDPKTVWPSFLDKELSSLSTEENGILPTLKLSYDCLPSHLKHCFAYCSLFPKDYEFDVRTLINLWSAQGFIRVPSDGSQSLEQTGYDYFFELHGRCFFQEVEVEKIMDMARRCKMHDLVHDLAIQVAGKGCVFLSNPSNESNINDKVRHFSSIVDQAPSSLPRATRLRSFLHPGSYYDEFSFEEMVLNFEFLRILDMKCSNIRTVPNSIGKLKHLRYLDLSYNREIEKLPNSITNLVNLQTLKLNECGNICELPSDINKLVNLRHLEFSPQLNSHVLSLPRGVSQLTNLQTLSYILLSDKFKLDDLMGLNSLGGNLVIIGLRNGMETSCANLETKEHLRSLELEWTTSESDDASQVCERTLDGLKPHPNLRKLVVNSYGGVRFSDWLNSLTNLVELKIQSCNKLKEISSLERFCSLKKLSLSRCDELEYIITDVDCQGCLPSLQKLELNRLINFRGWKGPNTTENAHGGFSTSYFPALTVLKIGSCLKLTSMPVYPNVKELYLYDSGRTPFEQTVLMKQSTSSTFYPLSKVKKLQLYCPNETVVQHFPDWIQSLSSLEALEMIGDTMSQCVSQFQDGTMRWEIGGGDEQETGPILKGNQATWEIFSSVREYLSKAIQYITSLRSLVIGDTMSQHTCQFQLGTMIWDIGGGDEREIGPILKGNRANMSVRKLSLKRVSASKYLSKAIQYITSLEELCIEACEEGEFDSDGNDASVTFEALTSLRSLVLNSQPNLQDLVVLPEMLQRITTLQNLEVSKCNDLRTIPDWICKLSSLQLLDIQYCREMDSLPGSMSSLISLHTLKIKHCPVLFEGSNDPIKWGDLRSLRTLEFSNLEKLVTLPEGLQFATALQHLYINYCLNMTALPDWISSLSSLQQLYICECPKIKSLPGSISSLASLQHLIIYRCPILSKRCSKEKGQDWHKIKHIPNVRIR